MILKKNPYWSGSKYVKNSNATPYAYWEQCVIYVDSISLNKNSMNLTIGDAGTLYATVLSANASNAKVNWFSTDTQVAIMINGTVEAVGVGSTEITAESRDETARTAVCIVNVLPVYVQPIDIGVGSTTLSVGQSEVFSVSVLPLNATDQCLYWTSSDENIAIAEDGMVTAIAPGTVNIKAIASDGSGVFGQITIMVTPAVSDFHFVNDYLITMVDEGIDSRYPVSYVITPADMAGGIIWTSSNTNEANVDANGLITAVAAGRAIISAEIPYGPSESCIVNVRDDLSLPTLPANLLEIRDGAFSNIAADRAVIRDACTTIGSGAFEGCWLRYVLVHVTAINISDDTFDDVTNICLIYSGGSEAQKLIKENGIEYIIDDATAFVSLAK